MEENNVRSLLRTEVSSTPFYHKTGLLKTEEQPLYLTKALHTDPCDILINKLKEHNLHKVALR